LLLCTRLLELLLSFLELGGLLLTEQPVELGLVLLDFHLDFGPRLGADGCALQVQAADLCLDVVVVLLYEGASLGLVLLLEVIQLSPFAGLFRVIGLGGGALGFMILACLRRMQGARRLVDVLHSDLRDNQNVLVLALVEVGRRCRLCLLNSLELDERRPFRDVNIYFLDVAVPRQVRV